MKLNLEFLADATTTVTGYFVLGDVPKKSLILSILPHGVWMQISAEILHILSTLCITYVTHIAVKITAKKLNTKKVVEQTTEIKSNDKETTIVQQFTTTKND